MTHHSRHYTVEQASVYTRPDTPPPIYISGFGPKSVRLAGRIGDGYISTKPDRDLVNAFRDAGAAGKPAQGGYKVCWGTDDDVCVKTAHRIWGNENLPDELAMVLPSPRHFEQASALLTEDMTRSSIAYGNDLDRHIEEFRPYLEAGFDEIHISHVGGSLPETSTEGFFGFYGTTVLPELRRLAA